MKWKQEENPAWDFSQLDWDDFRGEEKHELHKNLVSEQGYICCYCGRRIALDSSSHIEHLKPKDKGGNPSYAHLIVDYYNLLASCQGYTEEQEQNRKNQLSQDRNTPQLSQAHCGAKKDNWYDPLLMVSPLNENCAEYFAYIRMGEIEPIGTPTLKAAAKMTIEKLGLNDENLKSSRRKAIQGVIDMMTDDDTEEDVQKLIDGFNQPDPEGKYIRFCASVIYILKHFYS